MNSKKKNGPVIDVYPETPKPAWVVPGAACHVLGEGADEFTIDQIFKNRVTLLKGKRSHGAESFEKLIEIGKLKGASRMINSPVLYNDMDFRNYFEKQFGYHWTYSIGDDYNKPLPGDYPCIIVSDFYTDKIGYVYLSDFEA